MEMKVVGTSFRLDACKELEDLLKRTTNYQCSLEPEPDNKYDPDAVKVLVNFTMTNGTPYKLHIGYLSKSDNQLYKNWKGVSSVTLKQFYSFENDDEDIGFVARLDVTPILPDLF